MPVLDAPRPLLIAHRGGAAYAPNVGVENTVAAFERAAALGFGWVETDVRASADGVPVLVHDPVLDRLCGVPARVEGTLWSVLRGLRVGGREPLPRLDDVLAGFPRVRFVVDVKCDAAVRPVVEAVRRTGACDRVLLAAFSDRRVRRLRTLAGPTLATSSSSVEVALLRAGGPAAATGARRGAVCVQVPVRTRGLPVLSATLVERAHRLGMHVHVWGVEDPAGMREVLDLGVDGLIADDLPTLLVTCRS